MSKNNEKAAAITAQSARVDAATEALLNPPAGVVDFDALRDACRDEQAKLDALLVDVPAVAPFKSDRAAKVAYTKAEKAWQAKKSEGFEARDTYRETFRREGSMDSAQYAALLATEKRCEREAITLFEVMRAIYKQGTAQGFHLPTWHFGHNPTRDLIAMNMD